MLLNRTSSIEALEMRIAPALVLANPLADLIAGPGTTKMTVELGQMFDATVTSPNRTLVTFTTNFDADPNAPGIQPSVFVMELFDDLAPLTVQNFLSYVQNPDPERDYTDTFFHRSVSEFVVQGGGFEVDALRQHIPVGLPVHNEFSPERSNLRGTVAMAKTGLSPHSATSEWFVNLSNNSANLDNQNGGFTVFGRIVQGLDVFDKIDALPTINRGGALTDLPVQNYNADPDNNPATPSPKPTADQLIRITDTQVTKPQPGNTAGLSYAVVSVTDAATGQPTDLVTPKLVGSKLKLKYTGQESGVANVTIRTTNAANETATDTFSITIKPNAIAEVRKDLLPVLTAPGEAATVAVKVFNSGAALLTGNVDVKFYLSKRSAADPEGTTVNAGDLLIGQLNAQPVSLASGASTKLLANVRVPRELVENQGDVYRVIAEVTPSSGSGIPELFSDDNVAVNGNLHAILNQFGSVTAFQIDRDIPKLVFNDAQGDKVVFRIDGPGQGEVVKTGANLSLVINDTTFASSLLSKVTNQGAPAKVSLTQLDIVRPIGLANLKQVDVTGPIAVSNGVLNLKLGDLTGNHSLLIGGLARPDAQAVVKLGRVADFNFESTMNVSVLRAFDWRNTDGQADTISAPAIDRLNIIGAPGVQGNLEADVIFEGKGRMSSFYVVGAFQNATFSTDRANIGDVTVGSMVNANFFVGTDARPASLADFTAKRGIGSFTVGNESSSGVVFDNSQVAAARIGSIIVAGQVGNGSSPFGFVADAVASYARTGGATRTDLSAPEVVDAVGQYSLRVL